MSASGVGRKLEDVGERVGDAANDAAQRGWMGLQPFLEYKLLQVGDVTLTMGGLIASVLALLATMVVSKVLQHLLSRYGERNEGINRAVLYTVSRLIHYVLLVLGAIIALELLGIPIGKFTVFAGALGVGLGFGLQAIFNNFVSGLILLFDRSLKVGDFVELASGVHGEVRDIKIRATRISTNDNIDILVPNSEFVSGRVVNWTHREVSRRIRVPFGVAYGTDKELVKKAALEAACEVPFTLAQDGPRKPQVWLSEFGDSSLNFELVVWLTAEATKRPSAVKAAYSWALHTSLQTHGIEIPFPQQDLHLRSLFGLEGEQALELLRRTGPAGARDPGRTEAPAPALAPDERAALSSNDAQQEVEREIVEEASRPAERNGQEGQDIDKPDRPEDAG